MKKKLTIAWAIAVVALALAGIGGDPARADSTTYDTYGSYTYDVVGDVSALIIDVYGAGGGDATGPYSAEGGAGGKGGHVQATIAAADGDQLRLNVGSRGMASGEVGSTYGYGGGDDGGGGGDADCCGPAEGGGGGGSSRVFLVTEDGDELLFVAGGGGGGGPGRDGGVGGGETGGTGGAPAPSDATVATGGSQTGGGAGGQIGTTGTPQTAGTNGDDQYGGYGGSGYYPSGGGGGGGYFGGGGGASGYRGGGGGGGSSFVIPTATDVTNDQGIQAGDGKIVITTVPTPTTTTEEPTTTTDPTTTTTSTSTTTTSTTTTSTTTTTTTVLAPLTVTSPNGGENWARGTAHTIKWSFAGAPNNRKVKIQLTRTGTTPKTLATAKAIGVNHKGTFSWTVPSNQVRASNYRIKITINGTTTTDSSNANFSIT
jgi:hypothetical protein